MANFPAKRGLQMVEGLLFTDADGREWTVTFEAPGKVLSVPPSLEKSGALLPEHEIRIVFTSGGETHSAEYTRPDTARGSHRRGDPAVAGGSAQRTRALTGSPGPDFFHLPAIEPGGAPHQRSSRPLQSR